MRIVDKAKKTSLEHDQLCVLSHKHANTIFEMFSKPDCVVASLEYPSNGGYVDLFIEGGSRDRLAIIAEIKTQKDDQSPGSWVRQLKYYQKGILGSSRLAVIVDYQLSSFQMHYLSSANVTVVYLDTVHWAWGCRHPNGETRFFVPDQNGVMLDNSYNQERWVTP